MISTGSKAWLAGSATRVAVTMIAFRGSLGSAAACARAPATPRIAEAASAAVRIWVAIKNSPRHANPHVALGVKKPRVELGRPPMRKEHWRRPAPSAPRFVARPVSGLTSCHVLHGGTVTFPSPKAQWLPLKFQRPTVFSLDHRCGGSVGIARSPRVLTSRLTGLKYNPAPDATHGASGLPRVSS